MGHTFYKKETINVIEQSLPDQLEESEDETSRKGLPDACVYTENGRILIIVAELKMIKDEYSTKECSKGRLKRKIDNQLHLFTLLPYKRGS